MKRILAMAISVILVASMAIGGSIAYLTDEDSSVNVMTMGKVDIEQIEEQRKDQTVVNPDEDDLEGYVSGNPLYPAVYEGELVSGNGYWSGNDVVGAMDKIVSVDNIGKSDAYVRTWFAFEADEAGTLDDIVINWAPSVVADKYNGGTAVEIEEDGVMNNYVIYSVTYPQPIAAKTSAPASLLQVAMKKEANNKEIEHFGDQYTILVYTQAVQVENMTEGATAALNLAFKEIHPWTDGVATNAYIINTVADLQEFASKVNAGDNFSGKTVLLTADLDMSGVEWTPIGTSETAFLGTFNGQGNTISNLTVKGTNGVGLFGYNHGVIKNVVLENPNISGYHYVGGIAGYSTSETGAMQIRNNKVIGGTIAASVDNEDGDKVGGIIGYIAGKDVVDGNYVEGTTIVGYRHLGGIVGYAGNNCVVTNNEVKNITFAQDLSENYKNITKGQLIGYIVGNDGDSNGNAEEPGRTPHVVASSNKSDKKEIAVATPVKNDSELDAAIQDGADTVILGAGTYIIPDSAKGKTLTITGTGDTKIATQDDGSYEGCDYSLDGATVTFNSITINTDSSTYTGYARMNGTYNNCIINGTYTLYGDSVFNDCTFTVSGDVYNIWTWGAPTATFNNCTFNCDGKALLLYGQVNTKLTVDNCVFNDNGGLTDLKAAIEIGNDYNKSYELIVNNATVNGFEINDKGINTGTTLWANKNSMGTDKLNVVVDGVDVY